MAVVDHHHVSRICYFWLYVNQSRYYMYIYIILSLVNYAHRYTKLIIIIIIATYTRKCIVNCPPSRHVAVLVFLSGDNYYIATRAAGCGRLLRPFFFLFIFHSSRRHRRRSAVCCF